MHYHYFHYGVFAAFFIGQLIYIMKQASATVHSKASGINSFRTYFDLRLWDILFRVGFVTVLFGGWVSGGLRDLITQFSPNSQFLAHRLPVAWWMALFIGLGGDFILDFVVARADKMWPSLGLRKDLPPAQEPTPKAP